MAHVVTALGVLLTVLGAIAWTTGSKFPVKVCIVSCLALAGTVVAEAIAVHAVRNIDGAPAQWHIGAGCGWCLVASAVAVVTSISEIVTVSGARTGGH